MAEVSVIIPAYNSSNYIAAAINSVLKQDYKDMQIIVIDNASSDNTPAIAGSYGPMIKLMREEKQGTAAARNKGITASDSEFVAFLDADDIWLPNKITQQLQYLKNHPEVDILHTSYINYLPDGSLIPFDKKILSPEEEAQNILTNNSVCPSTVLMRRLCFENGNLFDPDKTIEDLDLWLRMLSNGKVFRCLQKYLTAYRIRNDSQTAYNIKSPEPLELLERFFEDNKSEYDLSKVKAVALGNCRLILASAHLWSESEAEFLEHLEKACYLLRSEENLPDRISRAILPFGMVMLDDAAMSQMTIRRILNLAETAANVLEKSCNCDKKSMLSRIRLHIARHLYNSRYLSFSARLSLRELFGTHGSEAAGILIKSTLKIVVENRKSRSQAADSSLAQALKHIRECETQSASDFLLGGKFTNA